MQKEQKIAAFLSQYFIQVKSKTNLSVCVCVCGFLA